MTDFWIAIILTFIVSLFTVLADWLTSRLILGAKALRVIKDTISSGLDPGEIIRRISEEYKSYQLSLSNSSAWGGNLAAVALSLDIATLGIWIHNSTYFPFFSRFNAQNPPISREIPVWLIIIGLHLLLLFLSLALKHMHGELMGYRAESQSTYTPRFSWINQKNKWLVSSNLLGFISLLSSVVFVTNAV